MRRCLQQASAVATTDCTWGGRMSRPACPRHHESTRRRRRLGCRRSGHASRLGHPSALLWSWRMPPQPWPWAPPLLPQGLLPSLREWLPLQKQKPRSTSPCHRGTAVHSGESGREGAATPATASDAEDVTAPKVASRPSRQRGRGSRRRQEQAPRQSGNRRRQPRRGGRYHR